MIRKWTDPISSIDPNLPILEVIVNADSLWKVLRRFISRYEVEESAFTSRLTKTQLPKTSHEKVFYIQNAQDISNLIKRLHANNSYTVYLFLVDKNCKIRWNAIHEPTKEELGALPQVIEQLKKNPPS